MKTAKSFTKVYIPTGFAQIGHFCEVNGKQFNAQHTFNREDGFPEDIALKILNRWNYLGSIQPWKYPWVYFLHTADGAASVVLEHVE